MIEEFSVDIDNLQIRTPVMLVIDASATMRPQQEAIRQAIPEMIEHLQLDNSAAMRIETGILSFNKTVTLLSGIKEVYRYLPEEYMSLPLECHGRTHIGEAVKTALNLLAKRVKKLHDEGIHTNPVCLILITDGNPNYSASLEAEGREALESAKKQTRELSEKNFLHVIAVGTGKHCNHQELNAFLEGNAENRKLQLEDLSDIRAVFPFISSVLSAVSKGKVPSQETLQGILDSTVKQERKPPVRPEKPKEPQNPVTPGGSDTAHVIVEPPMDKDDFFQDF